MKVQPTPTSPKAQRASSSAQELASLYRHDAMRPFERPQRPRSVSLLTLFLALFIALLSGATAAVLLEAFFPMSISDRSVATTRQIQRSKRDAAQIAQSTLDAAGETQKALLALYERHAASEPMADFYGSGGQAGTGILLSEDGWAVTTSSALGSSSQMVAVTSDRRALAVTSVIRDAATDLVFFRVEGVRFPSATFASDELLPATLLVALAGTTSALDVRATAVAVAEVHGLTGPLLYSSDTLTHVLRIDAQLPSAYLGGPLVNEAGKVVGIVRSSSEGVAEAWTAKTVTSILAPFLRDRKIHRSILGVYYVDVASVAGIDEKKRFGKAAGALLTAPENAAAIVPRSPAEKAGLKAGDLVVRVGGKDLDAQNGLNDRLMDIQPGTVVDVVFIRAGADQTVRVTLGDSGIGIPDR
ncbi:MAG: serine protease [Candidatus Kerfeldbacteria bacterium]|nr:serine protease [Candidatus Kerfeldbacteria bacterium]